MTDLDLYVTTAEAARLLGVGPRYVRYLCERGHLSCIVRANRLFVSRASLTLYAGRPKRGAKRGPRPR